MIIAVRAPAPIPAASTPPAARIAAAKTTLPKSAPLPVQSPAPYTPSGLLAAKPAPAIAAIAPPKRSPKALPEIAEESRKTTAASSSSGDAGAFLAMKGSILFAGLPDGPAPKSISTSEPNKLLHSAPLSVAVPADGLSLNPRPSPGDASPEPPLPSSEPPGDLAVRNPLPTPPADHP
jgi:hypothetical protein